ncbi:ATP-binding protein [Aestuariibius insulae]|uniref:ATP-binding protein n=1 Tax=Aestuariibius insulae TaxID=2058287 RepID=UPI00345EA467
MSIDPPTRPAPQRSTLIRLVLNSAPEEVRAAVQSVILQLDPVHLRPDERSTLELVLAEIVNNIAEHAYSGRPDGWIEISVRPQPDGISCRITDEGQAMPGGKLPSGLFQDLNVPTQDLPEGGFGWLLIKDLTRDLDYERRAGRNHLRFRMAIGGV